MQPTQNTIILERKHSMIILEDKPPCTTPYEKRIQEVVLPAMLVMANDGKEYLVTPK